MKCTLEFLNQGERIASDWNRFPVDLDLERMAEESGITRHGKLLRMPVGRDSDVSITVEPSAGEPFMTDGVRLVTVDGVEAHIPLTPSPIMSCGSVTIPVGTLVTSYTPGLASIYLGPDSGYCLYGLLAAYLPDHDVHTWTGVYPYEWRQS